MKRILLAVCLSILWSNLSPGQSTETSVPLKADTAGLKVDTSKSKKVIKSANPMVTVETNYGNIIIELFPKDAPKTVESFLKLTGKKYFDGVTFHRVSPGFVIQGGDPTGTGEGGPGYTIPDEVNKNQNLRGFVAMAKTAEPNSAGSQFYILLRDAPHLNKAYTVFGKVVKGMEVVDKIGKLELIPGTEKPKEKVVMKKVYIMTEENKKKAEKPKSTGQLITPGGQMTIKVGETAPDFTLTDFNGEKVSLSSFKGKSKVAIFFHPLDFTGV